MNWIECKDTVFNEDDCLYKCKYCNRITFTPFKQCPYCEKNMYESENVE